MTVHIEADTLSEAWALAADYLVRDKAQKHWDCPNLIVTIRRPGEEIEPIRHALDAFLDADGRTTLPKVDEVAGTIFPADLYLAHVDNPAEFLYENYNLAWPWIQKHPANARGTYFKRMIDYRTANGDVNQLKCLVEKLRKNAGPGGMTTPYEVGLVVPGTDEEELELEEDVVADGDLNVFATGNDRGKLRGFPCLSHVSVTKHGGAAHMTALYRNQNFLERAYGNYVGLSGLLHFIAAESGLDVGELVCVATHADMRKQTPSASASVGDIRSLVDSATGVTA